MFELELTADQVFALGGYFPEAPSALSPLRPSANGPTAKVADALRAVSALEPNGELSTNARRALSTLHAPAALGRVRVVGAPLECDVMTYQSPGDLVGISAMAGGFRLVAPAPVQTFAGVIAQLCGASPASTGRVEVEVPADCAVAVGALIDLQRAQHLVALGGGVEAVRPISSAMLGASVAGGGAPLSMQALVRHLLGGASEVSDDVGPAAMAGLVDVRGDDLVLGTSLALLADRLLLLDCAVLFEAFADRDEEILKNQAGCVIGGAHAAAVVELAGPETIRLSLVAPGDVVALAELYLSSPSSLFADVVGAGATARPTRQRRRREATPVAAPAEAPAAWRPTHRVPDGGLPVWAAPDGGQTPVATLDAGLEVEVADEQPSGWVRIVCSNTWSGWVDGRRLSGL